MHEFIHELTLGSKAAYLRSHWLRTVPEQHQDTINNRRRDEHHQVALRIAGAMSLSGLCGNPYLDGWPVAWYNNGAYDACVIFSPPASGEIDDDYVGNPRTVDSDTMYRAVGMQFLANMWDKFCHIGDVPTPTEVEAASRKTPPMQCIVQLPCYADISYHHGDDEPSNTVATAMPCTTGESPLVSLPV